MTSILLLVATGAGAIEDPRPLEVGRQDAWIGNAVCYGPHRDGQRPGEIEPSADELREDLLLMAPHWSLLRVYGASGFARTLLSVIREERLPMKVVLGVWLEPDTDSAVEIEAGIRLAHEFPDVVAAVSVGNETQVFWSAHRMPIENLIAAVRIVRGAVSVPVTVADDFNFWNKAESRDVAGEVDFILMHAHPMWNGQLLDDALGWLQARIDEVQAVHPGVPVVLGETGWATSVADSGEQAELIRGTPGEAEQARFYEEIRAWALGQRRVTFWFEAFDENWKGGDDPAEVEKHWGVFRADRTPKLAVQ